MGRINLYSLHPNDISSNILKGQTKNFYVRVSFNIERGGGGGGGGIVLTQVDLPHWF